MKTEAKVGAFTAAGLVLLVVLVLGLSGFSLKSGRGYMVYAGFHQVIGLEKQAKVCLAGVPIGEVTDISNDGGGVTVALRVQPDVRIPEGSHVTIGTPGVMGEKFVNVQPAEDRGHYIGDGAYLIGDDEQGMDSMFAGINAVVGQAQELLSSLNSIAGDKGFRQSILQMTANMRDMTAHLSGLMAQLESMAAENRGNVKAMTANLVTVTESMNRTMVNVEHMMANMNSVLGDPQTAENVRATLDDLEKRVATRRASLEKLKQTMRDNQALLAPGAAGAAGSAGLNFGPSITTPSMWPARGEVSSPYGLRWGGSDFHPGIDIANDMGTPIVATADGTVSVAGWNSGGYGNMVDIDHGNGIMTRYGHAMQVVVVPGQHVRRGQVIAYMGSTGYSTGPHVHYEVRINGSPVNPVGYL